MLYFGTPISLTQTPERLLSLTTRDTDEALIAIELLVLIVPILLCQIIGKKASDSKDGA